MAENITKTNSNINIVNDLKYYQNNPEIFAIRYFI